MQKGKIKFAIPTFILALIFLVVFIIVIIFYIWPQVGEIKAKKDETKNLINTYENIKKAWISYSDFQSLKSSNNKNVYLSSLFTKVDKNFFEEHFVNKENTSYEAFHTKKVNEISKLKTDKEYRAIQDSYKNILPTYIDAWTDSQDGAWIITDLKFVTYIESILHTFKLTVPTKRIEVWTLNIVKEYGTEKESTLDTPIYYIPYSFDVSWKTSDILDFIYFLDNVWSIKISSNNLISFSQDNFIFKQLDWYNAKNILENQIIDIEKIELPKNIDWAWSNVIDESKIISNIKSTQWNEEISAKVDARFYVKSIPNYKVMEALENLNKKYSELKTDLEGIVNKKTQWQAANIEKAKKGLVYLTELDSSIKDLNKQKTDLEKVYEKIIELTKIVDYIRLNTISSWNY